MKLNKFDLLCKNIISESGLNDSIKQYYSITELEDGLFEVIDNFIKTHNIDPDESADSIQILKKVFDNILKTYEIKFPALNKNIDELKSTIEIPENYFDEYVQPIFDNVKLSVENREDKDDTEREFIEYELTDGDKESIIDYIKDECARWSKQDVEKSVLDPAIIKEMIMTWITDNFDVMF